MWKYNFKCAQFFFWKKIGTALASPLKGIQKQSNIITHVEQWQKSNKLIWHWRLMWDECNTETQLPHSDFKAQIILHDSWPSRHAVEWQPTCQLICWPMHWPTYWSSVQQHVNQQSTDMAIKSRSTYQPIVLHDTRPRGCTNYARSLICTNSKCKSVTKCTSAEFWVPVAQIMDRPVCSCQW